MCIGIQPPIVEVIQTLHNKKHLNDNKLCL